MTTWFISGTGTNVGKTHFAQTLVCSLKAVLPEVVGWKPIETGVVAGTIGPDEAALAGHSTRKAPPTMRLVMPVSPNVAARNESKNINVSALCTHLFECSKTSEVVVELAGGLYSHLADGVSNADWVRQFGSVLLSQRRAPAKLVLVAPNRLGVLHDVGACLRAAAYEHISVAGLVLTNALERETQRASDPSVETNFQSLLCEALLESVALCELPYGSVQDLSVHGAMATFLAELRRPNDAALDGD
jgi:dethiobiotin synthetase